MGYFTITEDLISRLIETGEINEVAAETTQGIELGVARVLQSYTDANVRNGWKADDS